MSSASVYCLFQAAPYEHLAICDPHPAHGDDRNLESDFKSNVNCSSDRVVSDQSDRIVNLSPDTREYMMRSDKSTDGDHDDDNICVSRKKYSDSQRNDAEGYKDKRSVLSIKSDHNSMSKDIPFKHHTMMNSDKRFLIMIKSRPKRPKVKPPRKVATHGSCNDDDRMNASQSCTNDCDDDKAASESVRKSTVKSMTVQRGQENIDDDMNVGIDCFFQSPSKLLGRKKFGENTNVLVRGSLRKDQPASSNQECVKNEKTHIGPDGGEGNGEGKNLPNKNMAHTKPSDKIGIDIDPSKLLPGSDPRMRINMIKELKSRQKTSSTAPKTGGPVAGSSSITAACQVQASILNEMRERKNLLRAKGTSNQEQQVSTGPIVCGKKSAQDGETRDSQPVSPSSERSKVAIEAGPEKMSVKARASAFGCMLKPTGTRASSMTDKDGGDSDSCDAIIDSGSKSTTNSMTSLRGHQLSKVTDCFGERSKITRELKERDKSVPSNDLKKRSSGDESHGGRKSRSMDKDDGDGKE